MQNLEREPLSAFIICYNEEDNIKDCIESVKFCDEVLVIDSFSTDKTVEIANQLGVKVIQRKWTGYRDQKAYGLGLVTHEWVLNLDADERVSEELKENIIQVLTAVKQNCIDKRNISGYYFNRVVFYLGRWWRKGGWYPEYRLRLFKKSKVTWGGVEPHEKPIVDGATSMIKGELQHFTYKNMDEQFARLHKFSTIAAVEEYKTGRKITIFSIIINPLLRTFKFYVLKKGYREGMAGLIVAIIEGYYTFMKYAKVWEHEFINRKNLDV